MNVLQFWIGNEPEETQFASLQAARPFAEQHYLITDRPNIFAAMDWISIVDYDAYMIDAMACAGSTSFWRQYCSHGPRFISDFMRFTWPLIVGDVLYIDMDLILKSLPTINSKSLFAQYGAGAGVHLFYTNKQIVFFQKLLRHFEQQDPDCFLQAAFSGGWIREQIEIIPDEYFSHVGH